ncbi:SWR1-complex protein [Wickerhamomyces ciferrii]|uniref:SWR1-complex protein 4 n=1 Tax=Wickerhamomyces ciferrii (strain ATCC 14091 / BCRC 22168 / CBS 111 / JCM 3599 / NBRC 0793 / NRRL Y-1031 F-60-10) TaxID=1206466 RepID=K0KHE9_WICCF|nr:SWR1-complex protein [Wickerhamomyces ciferrii]CCH40764.1 SWR1-complex protein [Wickerhamomyces ciferrii]
MNQVLSSIGYYLIDLLIYLLSIMSSDILDVLNIQQREAQAPKKKQKLNEPKSKQLYNLLGQNTPPVAVRGQQKFKDRLNTLAKPSSWSWTSFTNGSRNDDLKLHHWVKGSKEIVEATEVPYKFEKYNNTLNIPNFTEDDYNEFIQDDPIEGEEEQGEQDKDKDDDEIIPDADSSEQQKESNENDKQEENNKSPVKEETTDDNKIDDEKKPIEKQDKPKPIQRWDYKETRYLFDLSIAFDLKWVVIHDRYNFIPNRNRSIEDLQERFYNVCQQILIHENEKEENPSNSQNSNLISNLNFNKKKEIERKNYLNRLLERSPAEIAEEESLLIEARKFEVAAKKTITERASLLQLLDSPQATGSVGQYLSSQGLTQLYNTLMTEKRKRRIDSPAPENPLTALNEKIKQQNIQRQKQIQQEKLEAQKKKKENPISHLFQKHLTPKEEEEFGLKIHTEKISPGVALRSTKITTYKPGVQTKITSILNEMDLGKKPALLTSKVVAKQEELYKKINTLLELKRQVDKLEAESKIIGK